MTDTAVSPTSIGRPKYVSSLLSLGLCGGDVPAAAGRAAAYVPRAAVQPFIYAVDQAISIDRSMQRHAYRYEMRTPLPPDRATRARSMTDWHARTSEHACSERARMDRSIDDGFAHCMCKLAQAHCALNSLYSEMNKADTGAACLCGSRVVSSDELLSHRCVDIAGSAFSLGRLFGAATVPARLYAMFFKRRIANFHF